MKLKSLILGTVAAAGLSTGAFAADLGVLTSLDVCDALGLSGLTVSSDTNCLQISGGVSYEFNWGDYRAQRGSVAGVPAVLPGNLGGSDLDIVTTPVGTVGIIGSSKRVVGLADDHRTDYDSKVEAWLKFVGTADSDFGPARAVIKLKSVDQRRVFNQGDADTGGVYGVDDQFFDIDEAYVSIGDSTVIMAGKKSSIANFGDSEPFNFTKLFGWDAVDDGIGFDADGDRVDYTGEHVIQIVSDLGNGLNVGVGLENLNGANGNNYDAADVSLDGRSFTGAHGAGTLVGVLSYAGEGITAHITGLAIGVLDGQIDAWGLHAGATGTFDNFRVRAAVGYQSVDLDAHVSGVAAGVETNRLHAMLTGEATFDMFTVALSGEYARSENVTAGSELDGYGIGGSIGAAVTDGVQINLGARYFSEDVLGDENTLQVAAQLVAAVSETIKVTGEVGAYWRDTTAIPVVFDDAIVYGSAELAWAPGGGFTTSIKGQVTSEGAYRATYKAAKTFE